MKQRLSATEKQQLNKLMESSILEETLDCWVKTRIYGASGSLACDQSDVCIPILRAFDKVRTAISEHQDNPPK